MFAPARLVYFAERSDQVDTAEQPRGEKGEDPLALEKKVKVAQEIERTTGVIGTEALKNLKGSSLDSFVREATLGQLDAVLKEAKELAALRGQTDKLVAKLLANPLLSTAARNRLDYLAKKAGTGKVRDLNAFRELAKQAEAQIGRLPRAAAATHEFQKLKALGDKSLFAEVQVSVLSEAGGNRTLKGLISPREFNELSLSQKNAYLQAMRDSLGSGAMTTEKAAAAVKQRDRLLADPATPDSWKAWLKNPAEYGHTLEYAANWVDENLGPLVVSTAKYRNLTEQVNRYPKGTDKLAELGVQLESVEAFQARSRHERDAYLDEVGAALAQIDAKLAASAAAAGSKSSAESHSLAQEMDESAKTEVNILAENLHATALKVKASTAYEVFQKSLKTKQAAALKNAEEQLALQQKVTRSRAGGGVKAALLQRFGLNFGAPEAANAANFTPEQASQTANKTDLDEAAVRESATQSAVDDFLQNETNQKETDAALGLAGLQPAERAQFVKLLFTRSENDLAANDTEFVLHTKNDQMLMQTIRNKTKWTQAKAA